MLNSSNWFFLSKREFIFSVSLASLFKAFACKPITEAIFSVLSLLNSSNWFFLSKREFIFSVSSASLFKALVCEPIIEFIFLAFSLLNSSNWFFLSKREFMLLSWSPALPYILDVWSIVSLSISESMFFNVPIMPFFSFKVSTCFFSLESISSSACFIFSVSSTSLFKTFACEPRREFIFLVFSLLDSSNWFFLSKREFSSFCFSISSDDAIILTFY